MNRLNTSARTGAMYGASRLPTRRSWHTRADEPHISYVKLIGAGGYGEVHQVITRYSVIEAFLDADENKRG